MSSVPSSAVSSAPRSSMFSVGDYLAGLKDARLIPATHRLVLLCLAKYADTSGKAWPSMSTIADWCGVCKRDTVRKAIYELRDRNFISVEERSSNDAQTSHMFTLHVERGQVWEVEEHLLKHGRKAPPGQSADQGRPIGGSPLANRREGGRPIGGPGVGHAAGHEVSNELSNELSREEREVAALLAPSTRTPVTTDVAPVTSPSPVVVAGVVQEGVQKGQQTVIPGMEAPKVNQKTKGAPRANSVSARTRTTRVVKTRLPPDFKAAPEHEELVKENGYNDLKTLEDKFVTYYTRLSKKESMDWNAEFLIWLMNEISSTKKSVGLQSGNKVSQPRKVDTKQGIGNAQFGF